MPWWRKPFTLIVVPHDGSNTTSFTINGLALTLIGLLLAGFLTTSVLVLSGFSQPEASTETKQLRQRIADLREQNRQYKELNETVQSLQSELKKTHRLQDSILKLSGFNAEHFQSGNINVDALIPEDGASTEKKLRRTRRGLRKQLASNEKLEKVKKFVKNRNKVFRHTPMLWPTKGWLSSSYGYRRDPMGGQGKSFHEGIDLAAWYESPIRAPAAGKVVFSGRKVGYGKVVKLRHEYGYTTVYAHLAKRTVQRGDQVQKGTLIGRVGSSGHSTGSHLHYEVRVNGEPVNPWPYLVQHYDSFKTAQK